MYVFDEKPTLEDLTHHGVKGQKWGIRKAADLPNAGYSSSTRADDHITFGTSGVKRINRRMNAGKTHAKAVALEIGRSAAIRAGATATFSVAALLALHGNTLASEVAKRAETNRGRAAAANVVGLLDKASATPFAKKSHGAFKITTL
jgi:hypothetical protein